VVVDTTVQEKNVAHPTDAKLIHQARERLVKLAKKHGLKLRQSHVRVGKKALIKQQRYAHAKQFRRARRELRKLKTWLGRVNRDIERQIAGDTALQDIFRRELWQAERVRTQKPRDGKGRHVYALHAPEVECIGKGKSHKAAGPQPARGLAVALQPAQQCNTSTLRRACTAGALG